MKAPTERMQQAWDKYPEHNGHNIGTSLGNVVCATCDYQILQYGGGPAPSNEIVYPFWRS